MDSGSPVWINYTITQLALQRKSALCLTCNYQRLTVKGVFAYRQRLHLSLTLFLALILISSLSTQHCCYIIWQTAALIRWFTGGFRTSDLATSEFGLSSLSHRVMTGSSGFSLPFVLSSQDILFQLSQY